MHKTVWMALASILFSAAIHAEDAATPQCELKRLGSVELDTSGKVALPVSIGDRSVTMSLNVATAFSSILSQTAEDLSLPIRSVLAQTTRHAAGASLPVNIYAAIDAFSIGGARFGNGKFLVYKGSVTASIPYSGMLGMDVLGNVDFELDLSHKKLTFYSQDHCAGHVVYWAKEFSSAPLYRDAVGTLFVPVQLDGKTIEATFNTWGSETAIDTSATRLLYGFDEHSAGIQTLAAESGRKVAQYRAMKMTTDGLTVVNANVRLDSSAQGKACGVTAGGRTGRAAGYTGCFGMHPLYLGRNILDKLRIYFATKENVVYFTTADSTN